MKNRLIPCVLACLMIFLVGCNGNTAKEAAQEITKTETSFPAGNTETDSQEETAEEPESTTVQEETPITAEESQSTAERQTVATVQTKPAEEKTADTPATEKPKAEPPKQTTTQAEPEKQTEQPKEQTTAEQKPVEKPTEKPAEPKPTEPHKQTFDVSPYVSYAKEYAVSIGLSLDITATECWDNPISANPMVAELTDLNRNLMMSIDIVPVPTDEAVREAESRLLGVETNITNWQRKQNQNNNFSATVPYDMEQQKKEMKEFLDDLTTRDQRMMFAVLTMVHTADSKEQLDNDTEALLTTARKHLCQFAVLKYQQMDGLNTAMPFGTRKIDAFRTLTTESLAVFIPFRVQDIYHENGIYYGQNVISKNMIIADRRQLLNGNSFILGVSGGGKSFAAKGEIENIILSSNADVIIIDPEREYSQLVKALGGEIINISATSPSHINAMDMNKEYGDGANPVILKSEFIMSLCEQLIGGTNLGAKQKSIIDRCTASVYRDYQQRGYTGTVPTLQDFRAELLKQDEPEAKEIALAIELFTHGSLNTFAKPTNVDTDNRLICYDILDLGKQLMPIGMLVVLDSILNRITQNRAKGKQTFIFIDEIYLLFQHEYSANFLFTLWKRVRKYGAYATGITQNVDDLLQSHTARTMLANSEFLIMLNQASTDRIELAKLLNISDLQLSYITNVDAGHGLIKVGSSLVPFANKFPKNTKLYKLMTTKPGEGA